MRFRLRSAVLLGFVVAAPLGASVAARAEDDTSGAKRTLDKVLAVLRDHQSAAGASCLDAMTRVHQTEEQVAGLGGDHDSTSNHPDSGADIARDVLDSDYETANTECHPDAVRACAGTPSSKACAVLAAAPPG